MAAKVTELDRLIRNCAQRLNRARDDARRLEGELEGLLAARNALFHNEPQLELPELPKPREISPEWREILCLFLKRAPNPASIDEVMEFIERHRFQINRNAVRSQLHSYVNRGFLERLGDGLYRATDVVKRFC
jgi:hypothetical protein